MATKANADLNRRRFLKGTGASALAGVIGAGAGAGPMSAAAEPPDAAPPYLINGRYDFDTPYRRLGTNCTKWDRQIDLFGEGVQVGMGIADLDFRSAPCIGEAMRERMQHENWGYLNRDLGYASLKDAICEWNSTRHGVAVDPDTLVIASGVHPGLIAGIRTFSPPGSRVPSSPSRNVKL